ncbi:GCN5 family acetyltransferase [Sorangium cellulosum]|uniref:GCN5 family acetyltransferase n=1 Tax=Sorangium cellulosum TaxID=56 RepID=A0A150RVS5_SORCE|nr:GCN5 family acetyltransferase [Sorangium cellulosum]KYF96865.1 GCN5 family acetyltransferase [Sorangium cellulosum]
MIRLLTPADEPLLWEMLYQAIHVPEGSPPPPRDIVHRPELSRYVQGWGQRDDLGVVALQEGEVAGAAWLRRLTGAQRGYGHVDDETPELSIALLPHHRGRGLGTRLLTSLLEEARNRYPAISLSVSPDNPALRLYRRLGFVEVGRNGASLTMVLTLADQRGSNQVYP